MTDDIPQNSWAPMTISSSNSAPVFPIASMKIWAGGTEADATPAS